MLHSPGAGTPGRVRGERRDERRSPAGDRRLVRGRRRGRGGRPVGPADAAGRLLGRLSVLPALLVVSWLLAGFPLLLIGQFTPVLTLVIAVLMAAVLVSLGWRWIPAPSPGAWPAAPAAGRLARPGGRSPRWWRSRSGSAPTR